MGNVSITLLEDNQQNVNGTEFNNLVIPLQNEVNGNLDNVNIKANANIACTKTNGNFGTINVVTSTGNITTTSGNITTTSGNLSIGGTAAITGLQTNAAGVALTESAAPTTAANQIGMFTKEGDSQTDLVVRLESNGSEVDIVKDGKVALGFGSYETTDAHQVGGSTTPLAEDTVYQAAVAGLVVVFCEPDSTNLTAYGYTGTTSSPTTIRDGFSGTSASGNVRVGFQFPVAKGLYWKVESNRTGTNIYFVA